MRRKWIVILFGVLLAATIVIAGFGQAVLQLWNRLMPQIFGLPQITFWQAVGLLLLSWILFGGWRGFGRGGPASRGIRGRWRGMTPEQRERFVKGLEGRGCGGASDATEPRP